LQELAAVNNCLTEVNASHCKQAKKWLNFLPMKTMQLDTLSYANRLKAAGMASALAEEQAKVMSEVLDSNVSPLATRSELQSMEKVLRGEIQAVEIALRGEIQNVEKTLRSEIQTVEKTLRIEIQNVETSLRSEIQMVEKTLRTEIKNLDHNIRQEMLLLEQRMVIKLGGMMVLSLGLLTTLTKLI